LLEQAVEGRLRGADGTGGSLNHTGFASPTRPDQRISAADLQRITAYEKRQRTEQR